jgi:hypothetical protein
MGRPDVGVVFADGSFFYEYSCAAHGWINLAIRDSHLIPKNEGKGPRINNWEFLTEEGVLLHPDGRSAGSLFPPGAVLSSDTIVACVRRGIEALEAWKLQRNYAFCVLVIDGAQINKKLPDDAINPRAVRSFPRPTFLIFADEYERWWQEESSNEAHWIARLRSRSSPPRPVAGGRTAPQ